MPAALDAVWIYFGSQYYVVVYVGVFRIVLLLLIFFFGLLE